MTEPARTEIIPRPKADVLTVPAIIGEAGDDVVVTARARADTTAAFRWIADRSPAAARWYAGLQKAIAKLGEMPERHPVADDETEQIGSTLWQMLYGRRGGNRGSPRKTRPMNVRSAEVPIVRHALKGGLRFGTRGVARSPFRAPARGGRRASGRARSRRRAGSRS